MQEPVPKELAHLVLLFIFELASSERQLRNKQHARVVPFMVVGTEYNGTTFIAISEVLVK